MPIVTPRRTAIGWPLLERDDLITCRVDIGGGKQVVLHVRPGDTCEVLMDLVRRFDRTVEPLDLPGEMDDWSYAKRPVRGDSTIWSEHSGGTALDLNATRHPRGRRGTFSKDQVKAIRALLDFYEGLVAWGGDFGAAGHTGSTPDEMHFQINKPPGDPLVARIAAKIRAEMEDDMPSADEVAEAVYKKFTHQAFTADEAGEQLDKRPPVQIALVSARAALSAQNIASRTLTAVGELAKQVQAIAVAVADDATKAQVQEIGDKIDQLLAEAPVEVPELPSA